LLAIALLLAPLALAQNTDDAKASAELARMLALPLVQRIKEMKPNRALAVSACRRQAAIEGP
jgi:hypothetical protein